jgi:IPT/TIG domain
MEKKMTRFRAANTAIATLTLVIASVIYGGATAVAAPANDDFSDASAVAGSDWTTTVSTIGASTEASEPTATGDASTIRTSSVWLSWTAPASSRITLSASSDDVPSVGLGIYQGKSVATVKEKAFSTDGLLSNVLVTKDQTYLIQVSGVAGLGTETSGSISVGLASILPPAGRDASTARDTSTPSSGSKVSPAPVVAPHLDPSTAPVNDNFSAAIRVDGPSWYAITNNTSASTQSGENTSLGTDVTGYSLFRTVWYKWKAPANGSVTVSTEGSAGFDTGLAILTGSSVSHTSQKAWNDQQSGLSSGGLSQINSFKVVKGTTYYFQAGSAAQTLGAATSGTLQVNLIGHYVQPSYDNLSSALVKSGTSWSTSLSDVGATIESESGTYFEPSDDPDFASYSRLGSNWIKWTPTSTGTVDVNTNGSGDLDTYIAVFEQDKFGNLNQVGFDDEGGIDSWSAITGVTVLAQSTYFIQVGIVSLHIFNPLNSFGDDFYDTGSVRVNFSATYTGPTVTSVSPSSGRLSGGKTVKIYGARLAGALSARFGPNTVGIDSVHSTYVVVTTPAGLAKKKYLVTVTTPAGTSLIVSGSHYTYN